MDLRELRMMAVLTQKQLADQLFVGQSAVANWEAGLSKPQRKYRPLMAKALHCTEEELERALDRTVVG